MICIMDENNYCAKHGRRHIGHAAILARDPSEIGERHRALWDGISKPQSAPRSLKRSFPLALLCQHNTGVNGTSKAGCGSCKTYGCSIKGTVKISECANCDKWEKLQPAEQVNQWPALIANASQDCSDKDKAIYSELSKNANWPTVPAANGSNKISLKTVVLSFPMGRNCRYNKGVNGFVKSNHVKEKTFDCAVKGTIRISTCDKCQMWEARQPARSIIAPQTQYNSESRHLLFHLWPKKTSAGTWQRNLDQLKQRWQLFTGKKVIAVATSVDTHSLEAVQDYMHGYDCEWVHVDNDPALREVKTFYQLFDRVEGLPGYTFYAQGKGVSKPINRGVSIHNWTMAMYEILLDYWPLVEQNLKSKPVVGCFKKSAPGMFGGSQSTWHYSGSFAWFRNDELFARNWRVIEQIWFGVESYPSMVFSDSEAACLFHCHNKQFNLYSLGYWKKVERELEQWRSEAAKYRSAGGLLMTS